MARRDGSDNYDGCLVVPIVGFLAPLPIAILHLGLSNLLDLAKYLFLRQFKGAHVVGVVAIAHDTHLMRPKLQRIDSAVDERPKEIVAGHTLGQQLLEDLVDIADILFVVRGVVLSARALIRRTHLELAR